MKQPIIYERLEGVAVLVASLYFYQHLHFSFIWFAILLFLFDISMVGYLVDSRAGAHAYNLVHSMIGPSILLIIGTAAHSRIALGIGLIWFAHI